MKILGLDLGTNSIGWAVVDTIEKKVIKTGVRIFPEGVEPKTIGQGDKEQSKNATRRDKRQMRRQFYRKRLRKIKLLEVLIQQGMCPLSIEALGKWKNWNRKRKSEGRKFPDTEEFNAWIKLNPYDLREKALEEELTLHELGRIFYHLIQRRGFLSNRKGKEDSAIFTKGKPDENILPINETKEHIANQTLGKYLKSISYPDGVPYRTITDKNGNEIRVRGRYTVRDMYIEEFEKIWMVQSQFHDIDKSKVNATRTRELKGTITSKRNQNKIEYLRRKFGEHNVQIKEGIKGKIQVTTTEELSLKEFLGGKIEFIQDDNGEEKLQFKSNESVLFWQRPLRSQKGLLSNCRFEDNLPVIKENGEFLLNKNGEIQTRSKKPCPLSHPEFELFRAYQFINNITYGKNQKLTKEQKIEVLDLMNKKDRNFDFSKIPEVLKLTYEKFNYGDKQKVAGNPTIKALKPLFEKDIWDQHFEEIWHCFYFYEDNEKLFEKLKMDFGFKQDIEAIKKVRLKEGYSNVSLKAIRNILPFLSKGYQFDRAVILGGVKNAFGKRWEHFSEYHSNIINEIISILKEDNKEGEAIEKIKEHLASPVFSYGFEKDDPHFLHLYHHSQEVQQKEDLLPEIPLVENLRNPIVQQGIHEMRRLVNSLLKEYRKIHGTDFHFDRINVEMGRDLRNNKEGRREMTFRISENAKKNDEARERLAEHGLRPSRDNIQKYLMYKEIEDRVSGPVLCPYTGKVISLSDLLGRNNAIQIEHIIPLSISLDDGFGNKTLCEANFNREKSEKTPWQFYKENPDPKLWGVATWEAVEERAFRLLPYRKSKKFTAKREFEKSDFIKRQLNDSRYIAKKAVELLSNICKDVRVMPGQLTAELRHLWGLNNILQPVRNLDLHSLDVEAETSTPYYVLSNETGDVISIHPKLNKRPKTASNEILVPGNISKEKFTSKYFKIDMVTPELSDGKYWAKLDISEPLFIVPKFIDKPVTDEKSIVFKGKVEKGYFKNDAYGRVKANVDDGSYWAKFEVLKVKFELPQKDKQPKTGRNQVMLFGNVTNGEFSCFIYHCETNLLDGKYWIILDLNPDNVEFIRSVNPRPEINNNELLLTATVDETGVLTADLDNEFKVQTSEKSGKYYVALEILSKKPELYRIENEPPKPEKDQQLIEGNIWVDKYTGEIKFDPKKNRDDHRHHAIDAITIALTEQGYLQRLSTYNAQRKEKQRQKLDSTEKFPEPWDNFHSDVRKAVVEIFISHKKNNKTLTKNKKGFGVRGQLHKEFVFGRRQAPGQDKAYHRRKKITEIKDNKLVGKIVDKTIRDLIENHLRESFKINIMNPKGYSVPKDAFFKGGKWRIFLPNKNGEQVPVKKVRIKEPLTNAIRLKLDLNQYVNPRNNHHVIVYFDNGGDLKKDVVPFWTVVERKLQGSKIYQLPEDGEIIKTVFEINDMFLLGINDEDFSISKANQAFLSSHLYKVQKIAGGDYFFEICFRHHLDSRMDKEAKFDYKYIKNFGNGTTGWYRHNPIKVNIDMLGNIKAV